MKNPGILREFFYNISVNIMCDLATWR